MQAPAWTRSARLRLTLTYSLALYIIGALVLGAIYLGLSRALDALIVELDDLARGIEEELELKRSIGEIEQLKKDNEQLSARVAAGGAAAAAASGQ